MPGGESVADVVEASLRVVHGLVLPASDTPALRAAANTSHAVVLSRPNILEYWRSLRPRPARFSPANHDRMCWGEHSWTA
jgi:hypothetical protein